MAARIFSNNARGTMTSAIWKVIDRPCRTIFAPIFTSRWRSVLIDHCAICPRQRQGAQEVGQVVGQRVQLQPHGIRLEALAGQPVQVTAFLPSLIHCSAVPRWL